LRICRAAKARDTIYDACPCHTAWVSDSGWIVCGGQPRADSTRIQRRKKDSTAFGAIKELAANAMYEA